MREVQKSEQNEGREIAIVSEINVVSNDKTTKDKDGDEKGGVIIIAGFNDASW